MSIHILERDTLLRTIVTIVLLPHPDHVVVDERVIVTVLVRVSFDDPLAEGVLDHRVRAALFLKPHCGEVNRAL